MKVSIIIPAKNEEAILPKLLATIKAQSFQDYEIVLADANSTDRTREIASSFGARVVEGGMPGPGRNRGAEAAQGDILIFADADVEFADARYLKDMIAEFEACGADVATAILVPQSRNIGDRGGYAAYNTYAKLTQRIFPHAFGGGIISRREVHNAIGGFDERVLFAEDHEYVQRAHKKGYRFRVLESRPLHVSVRRLDKDGRLKTLFRYLYGAVYTLVKGPFYHMPFAYDFDHAAETRDGSAKAFLVTLLFAAFALIGWWFGGYSPDAYALALYILLLIQTFFSVRCFSTLIDPKDKRQMAIDGLLVLAYAALAWSMDVPGTFFFYWTILFLLSAIKYAMLIGRFDHPRLLRRKLMANVGGIALGFFTMFFLLSVAGEWYALPIFAAASVYYLFIRPLYVPDTKV